MTKQVHAVTGAFGFSGRYIATRLLEKGHEVVTLTNSPNRVSALQGKVGVRSLRFENIETLTQSLSGVEVLYNTYWVRFNHPTFTHADAVKNTLNLFEAAKRAGVKRVVHVSIANANINSPFEYYHGKGQLEIALQASGLSHAILRPAVLFGDEGILINNIAWTLRKLPVFACFGSGNYHLQPIYVDDLAALAVEQGELRDNTIVEAIGPEDYSYKDLVHMIGKTIGADRPIVPIPPALGLIAATLIGKLMGDIFVTKEEIGGLMADLLHVPGATPTGGTRLSDWVNEHRHTLGTKYASELARRLDTTKAYSA